MTAIGGMKVPVCFLRAGMFVRVSDLANGKIARYNFASHTLEEASFFIKGTNYSHSERSLSVQVGDNKYSLEEYLEIQGISGGSVR